MCSLECSEVHFLQRQKIPKCNDLKQPVQNYEDGGDEGSGDDAGEDFEYVEATEGGCVAACQDILGGGGFT